LTGLPCRLEAAQAAARAFVEIQPPTILIGVVTFSGNGLVVQRLTVAWEAVLDTIDRLTLQKQDLELSFPSSAAGASFVLLALGLSLVGILFP